MKKYMFLLISVVYSLNTAVISDKEAAEEINTVQEIFRALELDKVFYIEGKYKYITNRAITLAKSEIENMDSKYKIKFLDLINAIQHDFEGMQKGSCPPDLESEKQWNWGWQNIPSNGTNQEKNILTLVKRLWAIVSNTFNRCIRKIEKKSNKYVKY